MKKSDASSVPVPFDSLRGDGVVVVSPDPVVVCPPEEDMARQEYKLQSDTSYQVQKFGAGLPFKSGEVDFDLLDLTKAFALIEESRDAWLRLPKVVRDRYRSWDNVEKAAKSGELEQLLKVAGADGGGSPSAPAALPSDSAAAAAQKPVTAS